MTENTPFVDRPWAGRFSRPTCEYEAYIVFVMRRSADVGAWQVEQQLEFPFPDEEEAFRTAKELVDDYLAAAHQPGMTAVELFALYRQHGSDPYIRYRKGGPAARHYDELAVAFDAWRYAEMVCYRLCGGDVAKQPHSLAYLAGRYDQYDRIRLEANLLLRRQVRLTRECSGMIGVFPVGCEGVSGRHEHFIGWEMFDWRVELPVVLRRGNLSAVDQPDNRQEMTFGIPYDALEFVESDEDVCKVKFK